MNLFFWKKPEPTIVPIQFGMTLEQWNNAPALADEFGKMLKGGALLNMAVSVLINRIPQGYPPRGESVNETQAAIELGRVQGYMDCLNLLQTLGKTKITHQRIEETYERTDEQPAAE